MKFVYWIEKLEKEGPDTNYWLVYLNSLTWFFYLNMVDTQ